LRFLPVAVAVRVEPPPRVTPVPGAPSELLGITMHEGAVVPVLAIGSRRGEMIVCRNPSELVGVVGAEIVHAGMFDAAQGDAGRVRHAGQEIEPLDVAEIYGRVQSRRLPHLPS
jgi:hypothetical protein